MRGLILAQCQPSLWEQHRDSHRCMDPPTPERALNNQRETSPLISRQTPSSITQHLSSKADFFFSFSWPRKLLFFLFRSQHSSTPPARKQTREHRECLVRPRAGVPRGRGTRWSHTRLTQPAVLVDIGSTVYFFKDSSLCIRCIAATGFVFKA